MGVLFAYIIIGYKKHYEVRPGPYIVSPDAAKIENTKRLKTIFKLYGVGFVLELALIRHSKSALLELDCMLTITSTAWIIRRE